MLRFWGEGPKRETVVREETKDLLGRGKKGDRGRVRVEAGVGEKGEMVVAGKAGSCRGAGEGRHGRWLAWAERRMESGEEIGWLDAGDELDRQGYGNRRQ